MGWLELSDNDLFDAVLHKYPQATLNIEGGRFLYIDNGSDILAVAHVDTVAMYPRRYYSPTEKKYVEVITKVPRPVVDKKCITSIKLDDRLGVHIILDILPALGVVTDVLLTDEEEYCNSSAYYFTTTKSYKWVFSFDRRGVGECVMYQYGSNAKAVKALLNAGWYFGEGTYSDIADLELDCVGFNFSAGYMHEHTDGCYCQYSSVIYNAQLFKRFYQANKNKRFDYSGIPYDHYRKYSSTDWDFSTSTKKYAAKSTITPTYSDDGNLCVYCGNPSNTWDMDGNPICDNCAYDLYEEPDKVCRFCSMDYNPDDEDEEIEGVCMNCGDYLRDHLRNEEFKEALDKMNIRLKPHHPLPM